MLRFLLLVTAGAVTAPLLLLSPTLSAPAASSTGGLASTGGDLAANESPEPCGGLAPLKRSGLPYTCTFSDEFPGTTLDTSKWMVQETRFSGMTSGNGDCFANDPGIISVEDGNLALTVRKEPQPFTCTSPFGNFTTSSTAATVGTRDRFTQAFGRFEIRARFPATTAPGVQSALWLYPQGHPYGAWPASGEIDIAEWFSAKPRRVYPSVHYAGEDPLQSTGYDCRIRTASSRFHTYRVDWKRRAMRFYYDGELCFRHSWTPDAPLTAPQPFDKPFYVVLTQVFGGAWNAVTPDTPESATLLVDWVRVWK